jgi:hypothetical protein
MGVGTFPQVSPNFLILAFYVLGAPSSLFSKLLVFCFLHASASRGFSSPLLRQEMESGPLEYGKETIELS